MNVVRVSGHSFIVNALTRGSIVLDCGANHGAFAMWISKTINCQVYGFEPDPRLFTKLPTLPRVDYHQIAVASGRRTMKLNVSSDNDSSSYYHSRKDGAYIIAEAMSLEQIAVMLKIVKIDLVKLDIEGAELEVLENADKEFLRSVSQITVEFHDFIEPRDRPRIERCLTRMRGAGFWIKKMSWRDFSDVLMVNEASLPLGDGQKLRIIVAGKYMRGAIRLIKRWISGRPDQGDDFRRRLVP